MSYTRYKVIRKSSDTIEDIMRQVPEELGSIFKYALGLGFTEKPNYSMMIEKLQSLGTP